MQKITFENYPSTNTPINADNLNLMQTNIESEINSKANSLVYTEEISLATNLSVNANSNTNTATYNLSPRNGYKPILISVHNLWDGRINLWYANLDTNNNRISWRIRNISSTNLTNLTIMVKVLYIKESAL